MLRTCRKDRSYIITGGLGGFGMALAEWLQNNGARHLVLTSGRGVRDGGQTGALELLHQHNMNVRPSCFWLCLHVTLSAGGTAMHVTVLNPKVNQADVPGVHSSV